MDHIKKSYDTNLRKYANALTPVINGLDLPNLTSKLILLIKSHTVTPDSGTAKLLKELEMFESDLGSGSVADFQAKCEQLSFKIHSYLGIINHSSIEVITK